MCSKRLAYCVDIVVLDELRNACICGALSIIQAESNMADFDLGVDFSFSQ